MYLSQLEILGFKSFPEKTILEFNGGVTAVVGPNGCGKTNILDSIRWVLGEQRSSVLRSSRMEEIIFNGTAQMKPLGLAEVNLTIKNNRGVLPVEYDEVVITRRLYRSGESEYFLNKSQCRLKDIVELFYDTGMGPHAYSVIQQGMIDAILSDKTEDRRSLFEEAAGVTKYKHRKKDALTKLEATESDILRLGDIMSEIEKQVNQLRRQAARARHYGRLKDELKAIELAVAGSLLLESQGKYADLEKRKAGLQVEIEALNVEFEKRELNQREARLRMTELEREASEHRQKQADLSSHASDIETEIKLNKHKAESAGIEIENCKREIMALDSRMAMIQSGINDNSSRLSDMAIQKEALQKEGDQLENELASRISELSLSESALQGKRKETSALGERMSAAKAELDSVTEMKAKLQQRLHDLQKDAEGIDRSRSDGQGGLEVLQDKRRALDQKADEIRKLQSSKSEEIAGIENALNQMRETLSKNKAELSGLAARQELLGQLIESGEGYSNGARSLRARSEMLPGIMLPIVDILEVPEKYRVAVTAALGPLAEVIPARSYADVTAAIEYLKSTDGGRASFLVLENLDPNFTYGERPQRARGLIGYLDNVTTCSADYRVAVKLLLGRVALFDTRENMQEASDELSHFTKVDLDGFVVAPPGIVSGGKTLPGVIGRRQDLGAIQKAIDAISRDVETTEREFSDKLGILQRLRTELAEFAEEHRRLDEEKGKLDAELGQLKFDFKEQENRYAATVGQARSITDEIDFYSEKLNRSQAELATLETESEWSCTLLDKMTVQFTVSRNSVQELENKLTEIRIRLIELDGLAVKLSSDIEHGRELSSEAEKMIAAHRANTEKSENLIRSSQEANEELETKVYDALAERREIQAKLRAVEDSITEFMAQSSKVDDEMAHFRREKDKLTSNLHSLEMEFLELENSRKAIVERLKLEFNVSSVEATALPEGQTVDGIRVRADEIRLRLQRMDPVNLMAAEDYEREKDRLDFLTRQRDDLLDARSSLNEAITRINTTAEARFNETFEVIKENFQQVFVTLFDGGEARVELEVPSNPLESPIKIMARPGGKRLLSVAQLSGGERALTAISLLFAIYLVKPSPFCILDEVDAPLDDANLLRFLKLIKKFSEGTQFIIITHNKMTMEASDILYGVTMETPGVSKVVSVKFNGNGNGSNG